MSMNKVILMGNITRDPEVRHLASGQAVCKFGVAMNRKFKTGDGQMKEEVTFVDCEAWGKTAETIGQYFAKGRPVLLEGRLKLEQWETDGQKRSKLLVSVESFHFCGDGNKGGGDTQQQAPQRKRPAQEQPDHDEIPF